MSVVPEVDVTLSRQTCRLGGTVVGTLRLTTTTPLPADTAVDTARALPGQHQRQLESLQLSCVGFCRLDPRWHTVKQHAKTDGGAESEAWHDMNLPLPENTRPFWSTRPMELMGLNERSYGKWEDVCPKPIVLPGMSHNNNNNKGTQPSPPARTTIESSKHNTAVWDTQRQLIYTFRIDLPEAGNHPPTMVATSCRYYYSIMLRLQRFETEIPLWIQVPVTVLTPPQRLNQPTTTSHAGVIQAMAHSSGLSTHITAPDLHRLDGNWSVHRQSSPWCVDGVQSMRVEDPVSNRSACFLTVLGAPQALQPGERLMLKLDFPQLHLLNHASFEKDQRNGTINGDRSWIACYSASACLQGEEFAIQTVRGTRTRARKHIFATAHESIDPETTESISLDLLLPNTAPCTVETDKVVISVQCLIDIAVEGPAKNGGFRNLHLQLPCQIVHGAYDWEQKEEEDGAVGMQAFKDLFESGVERSRDPNDASTFQCDDIQDELKILSLAMADSCGLRPEPVTTITE